MSGKVEQEEVLFGDSGFRFNDLPVEIISYIFEFVPYPYFLDIRYVCRLWYNVATQNYSSLDHEKVVCARDFGDPTIWMKSTRNFLHLSFQGEENTREKVSYWTDWLHLYDEKFWIRFGHKLRSLTLRMCQIDTEEFLKILSNCPQLRSLEIIDCKLDFSFADRNTTKKTFPNLLNLERFQISYGDVKQGGGYQSSQSGSHEYNDLNGQLFRQIVVNAPNIKSLLLRNCMNDRKTEPEVYLTSKHVLDYLHRNCDRITDICLKTDENVDKQTLIKLLSNPKVKLRRLETNFPFPIALIHRLESIETLDIDHHVDEQQEIEAIIEKLKKLRRLKLRCETYAVSNIFQLENLFSLDLDIDFIGYDAVDSVMATAFCCQVNTTLKQLSLKCFCSPYTIVKLAKTHPALTHLSLNCHSAVTDWSVQAIFKFLECLETLELATCEDISDIGIAGQKIFNSVGNLEENPTGYSIERLKNLSELNLRYFAQFQGTSFETGLVLPELRHLRLLRSQTSASTLKSLIKNHPRIETLDCQCVGLTDQLVDDIIRLLPRLRYFDAGNSYDISSESKEKMKRHCRAYIPCKELLRDTVTNEGNLNSSA